MTTVTAPHHAISITVQKDYTYNVHLLPGDPVYERLLIENPRKLKRMMKDEKQQYALSITPEYQQEMRETDARSDMWLADILASGEFARVFGKIYTDKNDRALLGLDADTALCKRDVKNAYRRQARKLHPDVGGSEDAFKMLNTAYRKVLANTKA